jgi:hypothetical protein
MQFQGHALLIGGTLLCGLSTAALADSAATTDLSAQVEALKAQVAAQQAQGAAQQAQIAELKAKGDQNWLNEQRTDEIKGLIRDALADADTRASLAADGTTSGNDGAFFIKTADDTFRLNIGAQIQVRYIANLKAASPTNTGHEDGFQIRRVEPSFSGYIGSPHFDYNIILQEDRGSGTEYTKIAQIGYKFDLGGEQGQEQYIRLFGGRIYDTFGREAQMSSKYQQTVERSVTDYIFAANDDIVEGVGVEWNPLPDYLKLDATFNDGLYSGTTPVVTGGFTIPNGSSLDFTHTSSDYAFTGRADVKIVGDWAQEKDVESWSTAPDFQAFVGAGFHFENNNRNDVAGSLPGGTGSYGSFAEWTGDTLIKWQGLGIMGAFYGANFSDISGVGNSFGSLQFYGATAQVGYTIADKVEPFARYEWIFPDGKLHTSQINIVTVGANYFIKKHVAKFTVDTMWLLDNVNATNTAGTSLSGTGLVNDVSGRQNEVVIRAQFQLLF